jgi:hypothetical protein
MRQPEKSFPSPCRRLPFWQMVRQGIGMRQTATSPLEGHEIAPRAGERAGQGGESPAGLVQFRGRTLQGWRYARVPEEAGGGFTAGRAAQGGPKAPASGGDAEGRVPCDHAMVGLGFGPDRQHFGPP